MVTKQFFRGTQQKLQYLTPRARNVPDICIILFKKNQQMHFAFMTTLFYYYYFSLPLGCQSVAVQ